LKKIRLTISLLLLFSSILVTRALIVEADSNDYIRLSSNALIFCPLNRTYDSRVLTLNLTFGVGLGVKYSMNYSIDGKHEGPITLVPKNPTELHVINEGIGLVTLPELSEGSHCLTVYLLCGIYDYHGANPPGAPFKPTYPGSADYTVFYTDTVYFTIDTKSEQEIPEFPSWLILPLFAVVTLVVIVGKQRLTKNRQPRQSY
jgi:hypothetical protein